MQDFDHKNVLTLHGVVIKDNTPYVLLPLMDKGDMKNYVADANNVSASILQNWSLSKNISAVIITPPLHFYLI